MQRIGMDRFQQRTHTQRRKMAKTSCGLAAGDSVLEMRPRRTECAKGAPSGWLLRLPTLCAKPFS